LNRSERCPWPGDDPLYVAYHDTEWGVPVRDDRALFEKLLLDGFQAGLSWITILKKRERYIVVYDGFQPEKIARYTRKKLDRLMADPGIVRNRSKIEGSVQNARAFLAIMEETGSFSDYLWSFTGGRTRVNRFRSMAEMPAQTAASTAMSKELKSRGFKFVGPTICYAFMQAVGMVNDHLTGCYRYREINRLSPASSRSPSAGHRK
jgi:DNA-3-methyladenine glycosylase I